MLKNYLKIALRSLVKQKVFSVINILGLSTGIASCLLIMMYVTHEFSYDNFHEKSDRIYKIALERIYPNHSTNYAIIPHSYGDAIQNDFAEVEQVVKMGGPFNNVGVSYKNTAGEEKQFEENFVMAADSNFFDVFTLKVLKGDPKKALTKTTDMVLTEETARRYFGNDEPLGKTLTIFGQEFQVAAVCENIPENSHLRFDFLFKWSDEFFGGNRPNFISFSAHTYLELKPGADAKALEAKFPKMVDTYAAGQIETDLGKSWADYKKEGNGYRYFLQPLREIHLDPTHIEAKTSPGGNANYVYFLLCVAILILVIACINFMNLTTARSAERAREVGVRKTMGSAKTQLVYQFLIESILLSFIGTLLALGIIYVALPYFNTLTGTHLNFEFGLTIILGLLGVTLLVGLLAGTYPAFVLSSFNPILIMKGNFIMNAKGALLRNGLVVFQFFISIILIVGTLVVGRQMDFMEKKSLGYDKEHMIVVERVFALQNQQQSFLEELREMPDVESVAGANALLGGERADFFGDQWTAEGSTEIHTTKSMVISDDFADALGFEFADGKGFSRETTDSLSIIINENAAKTFKLTNPVGQKLTQVQRTPNGPITIQYTIIGVMKDFNFQSLRDEITPLTIRSNETFGGGNGYAYVRVKGKNVSNVLSAIEEKWKTLAPGQPFKYLFLDESIGSQYKSEQQVGQIFTIFSGLAIIIACVGLFGLASYTANLRTKEIGVRKVLGATVTSVVVLLSKEFTKLIAIAFILSVPAGWYVMNSWLEGFAYHVNLGADVFVIAGILALLIAWLTVSYQSIKAAVVNPVKSLRSE
jgi:putative ABC transport system permease protein